MVERGTATGKYTIRNVHAQNRFLAPNAAETAVSGEIVSYQWILQGFNQGLHFLYVNFTGVFRSQDLPGPIIASGYLDKT